MYKNYAGNAVPRINVRVIPRARQNKISTDADGRLRIHITAAPVDGAANDAVIKLLAKHFDVSRSHIKIVRGISAHDKVIDIVEQN